MIYLKLDNVPLFEAYEDEIEQEANGKYQLSFKFPCSSDKWHLFTKEALLLADDLHGEQEFRIFEVVKRNGYLRIYANQVSDDLNYKSITKLSVDRVPGQTVMTALAGSIIQEHNFSFYSDIPDRHKFNQSDVTVMDALSKGKHSIIGQWGGELVRDKYQVKLMKKAGIDSEVLFMYKKNLDSFDQSESTKGLITRLHLKKVVESEETKMELKVTVDSPLISRYELIYEANIEVQDENVATIEQLRRYGVDYFRKNLPDIPENSLSISVADSSEYPVRLFDTAIVHHELYGIDMRMQITSYKYSPVSKRLKSVGFGKIKTSLMQQTKQSVQEIEDKVDIKILEQELQLQKEINNANRHFESEFEKGKQSIADGIEVAKAKSEQFKSELESKINSEIKPLANEAKQVADRANQSIASQAEEMQQLRTTLADNKREANQAVTNAFNRAEQLLNQSKSALSGEIAAVSQTLSETKRNLLEQARAQRELSTRVTTVEETANGTRTTVTELQKIVNATTGNLDAVSRRTKSVEDNLSGLTTKFENIRVGGRNLLTGTRDFSGDGWYQQNTWITDGDYKGAKVITWQSGDKATPIALYQVESGQTYTFSAWVKREQQGTVYFYLYDNDSLNMTSSTRRDHALNNVSNEFQRFSLTFTATRSGLMKARFAMVNSENGSFSVAGFQLVTGEIDSDWSVNSNEFYSELATHKQTVDRNFAELTRTTQTVTDRVTEYKSAFDQTAERFRTSLSALEVFKNNEGVRAQAYFNASREETARQIREERTAISENYIAKSRYEADARGIRERFEGLSVGGRNYIEDFSFAKYSSFTPNNSGWRFERVADPTAKSGYHIKATCTKAGTAGFYRLFFDLRGQEWQGKQMTFAVDIKVSRSVQMEVGAEAFASGARPFETTQDWQRFVQKDTVRLNRWYSFVFYIRTGSWQVGDEVYIRDPQLEDGNIATTPHASDKDTETRLATFERGLQGIEGKFTTLNNEAMKTNSFTINENGIVLQSGRTFDGRTIASLLTVNDDNIKAITDRMIITPNNENLFSNVSFDKDLSNRAEFYTGFIDGSPQELDFYCKYDLTRHSARGDIGIRFQVKYHDSTFDYYNINITTEQTNGKKTGEFSFKGLRLSKRVVAFKMGLNSPFDRTIFHNVEVYIKKSASLIVDGSITGRHVKANSLETGNFKGGSVTAEILGAGAVTAEKMLVNQAMINKLMTDDLLARAITASELFATSVQAVDISATRVTSGILASRNGAMAIDLDGSNITFNQDAKIVFESGNNAIYRQKNTHTAFLHFEDAHDRYGSIYVALGVTSSGDGIDSRSSGRFAGAKFYRSAPGYSHDGGEDYGEIFGDIIYIKDDFDINRGFKFRPSAMGGMLDMNDLYKAVIECARGLKEIGNGRWRNVQNLIGGV